MKLSAKSSVLGGKPASHTVTLLSSCTSATNRIPPLGFPTTKIQDQYEVVEYSYLPAAF